MARAPSASAASACRTDSQSSIMATDSSIALGLAMPWPAMSGAVPCAGWNTAWWSPMSPEGAMPMPPTSAAIRSDRMSPNMFSVTSTSYCQGFITRLSAIAST